MGVELVGVAEAVAIAVDPHADAASERNAGDRDLAPGGRECTQRRRRDRGFALAVRRPSGGLEHPATRHPRDPPVRDQIAVLEARLGLERVERRDQAGIVVVGAEEGDLAADRRRHAGVEREQERLDITAHRVGPRARAKVEAGKMEEGEEIVERAVVHETEAALVRDPGLIGEPGLLVQIPELGNFDVLVEQQRRVVDQLAVGPGSEVGRLVAVVARQAAVDLIPEEEVLTVGRIRTDAGIGHRAVEQLPRVRWIAQRQHECVERRHLAVGQLGRASHEIHERAVERVEVRAVSAPVQQSGAIQAAQALRHHRALHRMEALEQRIELSGRRGLVGALRVAEVPRDQVHVAEHVAGRACLVAVAGREPAVEELAAVHDLVGRRVEAQASDREAREVCERQRLQLVAIATEHVEALAHILSFEPGFDLRGFFGCSQD